MSEFPAELHEAVHEYLRAMADAALEAQRVLDDQMIAALLGLNPKRRLFDGTVFDFDPSGPVYEARWVLPAPLISREAALIPAISTAERLYRQSTTPPLELPHAE